MRKLAVMGTVLWMVPLLVSPVLAQITIHHGIVSSGSVAAANENVSAQATAGQAALGNSAHLDIIANSGFWFPMVWGLDRGG